MPLHVSQMYVVYESQKTTFCEFLMGDMSTAWKRMARDGTLTLSRRLGAAGSTRGFFGKLL